jgi:hypothetical protein
LDVGIASASPTISDGAHKDTPPIPQDLFFMRRVTSAGCSITQICNETIVCMNLPAASEILSPDAIQRVFSLPCPQPPEADPLSLSAELEASLLGCIPCPSGLFSPRQSVRDLSSLEHRRRAELAPDPPASLDSRPLGARGLRWRELLVSIGVPLRESCTDPSIQRV